MLKLLSTVLDVASITFCNGYEIDAHIRLEGEVIRLSCGDDVIATLKDEEIEIDSDGEAFVLDPNSEFGAEDFSPVPGIVSLAFRMSRPITAVDF